MNIKGLFGSVLLVVALLLTMLCSDPANPFADTTQAKAAVHTKSFSDRDTVSIFSRETLAVVVYLKEHVQEVTVHVDHNRLWTDADTTLQLDTYSGNLLLLPFSFYDTGWQQVAVKSLLYTGETREETYALYARSPLYQKSVSGKAGDTITLNTNQVADGEVLYVWDFHNGTIIKEYTHQTQVVLKSDLSNTIGEVYVTDPLYRSPSVAFAVGSNAVPLLTLQCMNDSLVVDSVYTGRKSFIFTVAVNGTEQLKSISVNDIPFDNMQVQNGFVLVSKTLTRMDTITDTMRATVIATDQRGRSVQKTFIVHYDSTIVTAAPQIKLRIPATLNDTGHIIQSPLSLFGSVIGELLLDKYYLQVIVNGTLRGTRKITRDSTDWTHPISLAVGWNVLQLELTVDSTLSGSILAATIVHLDYRPDQVDTVAPVINAISINGVALGTKIDFLGRSETVSMTVLASDNKAIRTVSINGEPVVASPNATGLVFEKEIELSHTKESEPFVVCVEDSAGNRTCDTLYGRYNHIPEITAIVVPAKMRADSQYVFTMHAVDADSDAIVSTVRLQSATVDTVLTMVNSTARWMPALEDTGALQVLLHVSDTFFESADTALDAEVYYQVDNAVPVSFKTTKSDFPDSLVVGGKPLAVELQVDSLTGTPPLQYTVLIENPSVKLYEGTNSAVTWSPERSDIGLRTVRFIVRDSREFTDTITVLITVVAKPAATVWLAEESVTVAESGKTDSVTFRLSVPLADSVTVPYSINFTSALPADIAFDTVGLITFEPGDTLVKMAIPIVDDTIGEPDENLSVVLPALPPLSPHDSLVVDALRSKVVVIIEDNDNLGLVRVSVMLQPDTLPVPEDYLGTYPAIYLTEALPFDLTVTVAVTSASTVNLSDYTLPNKNIVVRAGQITVSLGVMLRDDNTREPTEILEIAITKISDISRAVIDTKQNITRIQIKDND